MERKLREGKCRRYGKKETEGWKGEKREREEINKVRKVYLVGWR